MTSLINAKLFQAIEAGDENLTRQALSQGASVGAMDLLGNLPMIEAARMGHLGCMRALREAGASLEDRSRMEMSPLEAALAMKSKRVEITRWLLEQGANPNAKDRHGETAMHALAVRECEQCLVEYLKAGADFEIKNNRGDRPEDFARQCGSDEFADILAQVRQQAAAERQARALDLSARPAPVSGKRGPRV
jgi:ankyrin repeat protein